MTVEKRIEEFVSKGWEVLLGGNTTTPCWTVQLRPVTAKGGSHFCLFSADTISGAIEGLIKKEFDGRITQAPGPRAEVPPAARLRAHPELPTLLERLAELLEE